MQYPEDVQKHIDVLDRYIEDPDLKTARIFHMYPGELAYPNGYYDSRFFRLVAYSPGSLTRKDLGTHDSLDFMCSLPPDVRIRIFADGSTIIILPRHVNCEFNTQAMTLREDKS